jgi:hypothetical protein
MADSLTWQLVGAGHAREFIVAGITRKEYAVVVRG